MKMPFGKHKDEDLLDIPNEYLEWASKNIVDSPVRKAIEQELTRRSNPSVGISSKMSRTVAAQKLHELLLEIPDDMFGQEWILGPFKVRFDKR